MASKNQDNAPEDTKEEAAPELGRVFRVLHNAISYHKPGSQFDVYMQGDIVPEEAIAEDLDRLLTLGAVEEVRE